MELYLSNKNVQTSLSQHIIPSPLIPSNRLITKGFNVNSPLIILTNRLAFLLHSSCDHHNSSTPGQGGAQMSKRAKILIIDDETGPRESLKMVLKPFYDVFTANGRQDALALLQSTPMDLVTLDLKMADCHGTALLKEIKSSCPNTQAIILTGYGTLKSAIEAIRLGASDYLLKPFQVTEILSVINRVLTRPLVSGQMEAALHELERVAESSHP